MGIATAISAIAGVAGAAISASGSKSAGKAQAAAADRAAGVQRQNFLDSLDLIQPQITYGDRAREALAYEIGLGGLPSWGSDGDNALSDGTGGTANALNTSITESTTGGNAQGYIVQNAEGERDWRVADGHGGGTTQFNVGGRAFGTRAEAEAYQQSLRQNSAASTGGTDGGFTYRGFEESPGYAFRLGEGQKAIERSAAARGMSLSGATLKALDRYSQGYASDEYNNYLNRLGSMAGQGQVATGQGFQGYANQGNQQGSIALQRGNALASSHVGQANAWNAGLGNISSALGMYNGGGGFLSGQSLEG